MYFSVRGCVCYKSGVREVLIAWQAGRDLAVATKASVKGTTRADRSGLDWPPRETESLMWKEETTQAVSLKSHCHVFVSLLSARLKDTHLRSKTTGWGATELNILQHF